MKKPNPILRCPHCMAKDKPKCIEATFIKDRIEWLKKKCDNESEESRVVCSDNRNIDLGIVKKLIDDAFLDLTKHNSSFIPLKQN